MDIDKPLFIIINEKHSIKLLEIGINIISRLSDSLYNYINLHFFYFSI